jgi:rRNA maturation protein Nop10
MRKSEYESKFALNQRISGFGMDTTMHMPCPFCAEPEWMVFKILEQEEISSKEHVCAECGRGAKMIYRHEGSSISFEVVQTCGDDAPGYLPPMRRV